MSEYFSLKDFHTIPPPGVITAAEHGSQLISIPCDPSNPVDGDSFCDKLKGYKKINQTNFNPIIKHKVPPCRIAPGVQLLRQDEGVVKGMWDSWREDGWRGLEKYLKKVQRHPVVSVFYGCLSALISVTDMVSHVKQGAVVFAFPHLKLNPLTMVEVVSQVRNWNKAWVRAVTWHPDHAILALALPDDTVRIFEADERNIPLLRAPEQKNICCVAIRPLSNLHLAVGVEAGIVIWDLRGTKQIKPGACYSSFLSVENHAPVTSVEYSHSGLLLASSSPVDMSIYVWDVSTWRKSCLYRIDGGGVPFVSWSPLDDRILAASPTSMFRIWNRQQQWQSKKWRTPKIPIESACWTPDGGTLLFASGGMIYAIYFVRNEVEQFLSSDASTAVPVCDISTCNVSTEDGELEYKVGGRVRKMDMDPTCSRLVVCFDDSELIAVFRIQPKSMLYLSPCGFIRGFQDEYPLTIAFQPKFSDGALLTIAWSSGRLQYFPFLFGGRDLKKNFLHEDFYSPPKGLKPHRLSKPQTPQAAHSRRGAGDADDIASPSSATAQSQSPSEEDVYASPFRTSSFTDIPTSPEDPNRIEELRGTPRLFSVRHRFSQI